MTTVLVEQPTSVFPATRTTAFFALKKGGQFAALRHGQYQALRVVNLKRYTMVSLSVFSTVLSGIRAKLGTFSWTGPVTDKLTSERNLFFKLQDHPRDNVRKWAQMNIDELNQRIKWENDRNKDGYLGDFIVSGSRE